MATIRQESKLIGNAHSTCSASAATSLTNFCVAKETRRTLRSLRRSEY